MKRLSDSYLYKSISAYDRIIFDYLMKSDRVDKSGKGFFDIEYAIKKQAPPIISKVLKNNNIVLMVSQTGISRLFKVIYSRDPKDGGSTRKVFIDCSGIITLDNGEYKCTKIGALISYLTTAMTYVIYYNLPKLIISNSKIVETSTEAFVDLLLFILERLEVPVTYLDNKERMSFAIAEYYQISVLGAPNGEIVKNVAKKVSKIKENKTCDYLHVLFGSIFDDECDINKFISKFSEVFMGQQEGEKSAHKNRTALTIDAISQKWMYTYGPGTIFGLECFVPFSQILTDCYNGSYLNQQNTIEKVANAKIITRFSNELLKVGSENG